MPSDDLQRFLRAVRTLAKLAQKYGEEAWLEALGRYASVKLEEDVLFVGEFLDDIGVRLMDRRLHRGPPPLCCRQCGKKITPISEERLAEIAEMGGINAAMLAQHNAENRRMTRPDARYCSPKCRQKAHRARVTARDAKRERKRNGAVTSLQVRAGKEGKATMICNAIHDAEETMQ